MAAALTIINKHRLLRQWGVLEGEDAEVMAAVWIEYFDDHGVPWRHWDDLYKMAHKRRVAAIGRGLVPADITPEALVVCWPELSNKIRERDIRSGRVLDEMAMSACFRCEGTGSERIYNNQTGDFLGRRSGCQHRPLTDGEHLFKLYQEQREKGKVV